MSATPTIEAGPLVRGSRAPGPSTLVIFGATGDLAQRKLFPALYNLAADDLLPEDFRVIGCSRGELSDGEFRDRVAAWIESHSRRKPRTEVLAGLLARVHFLAGSAQDPGFHAILALQLEAFDGAGRTPHNRLFFLSIAPELFSAAVERLGEGPRAPAGAATRVLIEKPFGRSAEEARDFNRTVLSSFEERQVFRVDHYLGKEEVQNIMALRFANSMIEPFWNARSIASVQITAAEDVGIGSRAPYYEGSGALRDHLQNHLLQLLCMIAMMPPADLSAAAVRDEKVSVLEAIRPPRADEVVWGQYGPGRIDGEAVRGYLEEDGVATGSRTETYVAMRLGVETARWAGVPFYLRTGKRLANKETEIAVTLRPSTHPAFFGPAPAGVPANQIVIGLRPNGGIRMTLATKRPGVGMELVPATMVASTDSVAGGEAYERLLLDAMKGDATLFARGDEIEAQWRICDPALSHLAEAGPLSSYPAGSQGPDEADRILAEGDAWRTI